MTLTIKERFYKWLGLTSRQHLDKHLALILGDMAELQHQIKEERKRIGKLWFTLAELTPDLTQPARDRLNKRLLNRQLFEEEMDSRPMFPYGNDSRSPR